MKKNRLYILLAALLLAAMPVFAGGGATATPARSSGGRSGGPTTWAGDEEIRLGGVDVTGIAYGGNRFVAGGNFGQIRYADW
jgi:hypothetical protein